MQKKTTKIDRDINLAQSETNPNYWSPLTCLVKAQGEMTEETVKPITASRSESEREKRVFLKMDRTKH